MYSVTRQLKTNMFPILGTNLWPPPWWRALVCLCAGGKINGAWMSGFTVPGDKRHMHFAHHKMEADLIC